MLRSTVRVAIASLLLVGCTRSDPPADAAPVDDPAARRRERCESLARESAQLARLGGAAVVVALGGAGDAQATEKAGESLTAASEQAAREVVARCMTWPDDVIDCLGLFGALDDECEDKLAAALGVAVSRPPKDLPAGPAPAWSLALDEAPAQLLIARDGTLLARVDRRLVAVRDGAIAWRLADEADAIEALLLEETDAPAVLVARGDRLASVAVADGRERWSVALPPHPDEFETATARTVARDPGDASYLVGDSAARFYRLRPGRCAAKKPAKSCLTPAGRLDDEVFEEEARLVLTDDGRRLLREPGLFRIFDAEWRAQLDARAHDGLGTAVLTPDGVVALIDSDVVALDPARCGSEPFAPSAWPQPGRLHSRELDLCPECAAPPSGCRRWRVYVDDLDDERPALLESGAVVVQAEGVTLALADGRTLWKTTTGGAGPLLRLGDLVYGVSTGLEEDDPIAVFALSAADGAHRWRTPLPDLRVDSFYSLDEIVLAHGGGWLVAGYRGKLAAFELFD